MVLEATSFWIRLYDLPIAAWREGIVRRLASRVGEVKQVFYNDSGEIVGRYARVQVDLSIHKPLVRRVPYRGVAQEPTIITFKYERLQHFYCRCGFLGHVDRDCELQEIKDAPVQYGPFTRASPAKGRFPKTDGRSNAHNETSKPLNREGHWQHALTGSANPPKTVRKLQLNPIPVNLVANSKDDQAVTMKSSSNAMAASQEKSPSMPSLEDITPIGSPEPIPAMSVAITQSDTDSVKSPSTFTDTPPSVGAGRKWKRKSTDFDRKRSDLHKLAQAKK